MTNRETSEVAFDGHPANIFTLKNRSGMSVTVMDIGATWLSCKVPVDAAGPSLAENKEVPAQGELREVLLCTASLADHQRQAAYLGSTVGRYANRIAGGRFILEQREYHVSVNQGKHCLHGGLSGFDKRRWTVEDKNSQSVTFALVSEDGDQGFPGTLSVSVCYQLTDGNEVVISYSATTDKSCPVNLTNHAYFNLMGAESGEDCLDHSLKMASEKYVATDAELIPTGELKAVSGTGFDFRRAKSLGQDLLQDADQKLASGYDHAFVLDPALCDGIQPVATLVSPDHAISMEVATTKPALQIYTGNFLAGTPSRTCEYEDFAGIALESEFLPDSPNHPEWPDCILKPGQNYRHSTVYRFF